MGCDGGSIPTRAELVRPRTKGSSLEKSVKSDAWRYCAISKETLRQPVVTCAQGRLYNKEAVLETLLARSTRTIIQDPIPHIKSLKQIHTLKLTPNPAYRSAGSLDAREQADDGAAPFICPVTGREMNGNFPFLYLKACGCVLCEQALCSVPERKCLKCGKERIDDDVIVLRPDTKPQSHPAVTKPAKRKEQQTDTCHTNDKVSEPMSGMSVFKKTKAISTLYQTNHQENKT